SASLPRTATPSAGGARRSADPDPRTGALELDHPEIGVRSQPAIEPHLLPAKVPTLAEGPEIKEAQVDRLLDLVHTLPGQEHPRDVGFHQLYPIDRMRIDGGVTKSRDHPRRRSWHRLSRLTGVPAITCDVELRSRQDTAPSG